MRRPKFHSYFDRPKSAGTIFEVRRYKDESDSVGLPVGAAQHFKDQCDINLIVANYVRTGTLPPSVISQRAAVFADVSEVGDFASMQGAVLAARDAFLTLPASVRSRFGNDPGALLAFLDDPENVPEAQRLGLLPTPPAPAPPSTEQGGVDAGLEPSSVVPSP